MSSCITLCNEFTPIDQAVWKHKYYGCPNGRARILPEETFVRVQRLAREFLNVYNGGVMPGYQKVLVKLDGLVLTHTSLWIKGSASPTTEMEEAVEVERDNGLSLSSKLQAHAVYILYSEKAPVLDSDFTVGELGTNVYLISPPSDRYLTTTEGKRIKTH